MRWIAIRSIYESDKKERQRGGEGERRKKTEGGRQAGRQTDRQEGGGKREGGMEGGGEGGMAGGMEGGEEGWREGGVSDQLSAIKRTKSPRRLS